MIKKKKLIKKTQPQPQIKKPYTTAEVKGRAECLWRLAGCPISQDDSFWLAAEQELTKEYKLADEQVKQNQEQKDVIKRKERQQAEEEEQQEVRQKDVAKRKERQKAEKEKQVKNEDNLNKFLIMPSIAAGLGLICFAISSAWAYGYLTLSAEQKVTGATIFAFSLSIGVASLVSGLMRTCIRNPFVVSTPCGKCKETEQQSKFNRVLGVMKEFNAQEDLFYKEAEEDLFTKN